MIPWTKTPPTRPGLYIFRESQIAGPCVTEVVLEDGELKCRKRPDGVLRTVAKLAASNVWLEWAGPISFQA